MNNNLKKIRKEKGLTQIQLAKLVGVTNDYISQIERGVRSPGLTTAKKISDLLEKNIEEIFFKN